MAFRRFQRHPRPRPYRGVRNPVALKMIRCHEQWLSATLRSGRQMPRIPTRKVAEGGFAHLLARSGGREKAANWWEAALERGVP